MVEINIYKPIDREDPYMSFWGFEDEVFSGDTIHKIFDENKDETEFKFNINCDGGSVHEGLRIYDILRTSGHTLYTNIEGACHSMAVAILLAAPLENRTANPNARSLIHEVRTYAWDALSPDEAKTLGDQLAMEQDSILNIYADRTGKPKDELEVLLKEEKFRTSTELLEWGFISKVNTYSTNQVNNNLKSREMEKKQFEELQAGIAEQNTAVQNIWDKIKNFVKPEFKNLDINAEDGTMIVVSGDVLEVGAAVESPNEGTFTVIQDGKTWTVVIADNVVTEMTEVVEDDDAEESVDELKQKNEDLQKELDDLKASNLDSETKFTDLENKFKENETYVNNLKKVSGQFMKEDGTVNFESVKNLGKPVEPTMKETTDAVRELYKKTEK